MPEGLKDLTSTELRTKIANGESVHEHLPEVVGRFAAATGTYRPVYDLRLRLLDLLYGVRAWAEKECDFEALIRVSSEKTERGRKLREILGSDKLSPAQLKNLVLDILKSDSK